MIKEKATYILTSHQRCLKYNMDPDDILIPSVCITTPLLEQKKAKLEGFLSIAKKFMKKLISDLEGKPVLVVLSDHEGFFLEMYGDELIKAKIESLGLSVGVRFKEEELGTNSIAIALELGQPVQIIGSDHFHRCLHESACFSVPFYEAGQLKGTISVMMAAQDATSFHQGILLSAVDSIEREVKVNKQNKELLILNQVIIENSRNGIIIANEDGRVIELNPFAEKVLLCSKKDIVGHSINEVHPVGNYMENVLKKSIKYEDVEVRLSDKIIIFDSFPIFNESDQVIGVFGQFRDITERILLEKQVMVSEKLSAIGKIGAGLAHEIRNPLTSIVGLMQFLKKHFKSSDGKLEEYFRIIFSELERIKNLVNQFVLMARPEAKEISKSYISIHSLIEDIITLMEGQLSNQQIAIEYDITFTNEVYIDKDKMKQVFINMIQNAVEAIECEGTIYISINKSTNGSGVEISIKDEGLGMDNKTLEKLSTPFFSTKENGLGLGLSMSYNIIDLHRGNITVKSEKGKGTMFTIWLPCLKC